MPTSSNAERPAGSAPSYTPFRAPVVGGGSADGRAEPVASGSLGAPQLPVVVAAERSAMPASSPAATSGTTGEVRPFRAPRAMVTGPATARTVESVTEAYEDRLRELQEAHAAECAAVRASALAEGTAAGRAAEAADRDAAYGAVVTALVDATAAMHEQALQDRKALTLEAEEMAVALAGVIVEDTASVDRSLAGRRAAAAVAQFLPAEPLVLRLAERDARAVRDAVAQGVSWAAPFASAVTQGVLTIVPDGELRAGDFRFEGRERVLDGRTTAALERLMRRISDLPLPEFTAASSPAPSSSDA